MIKQAKTALQSVCAIAIGLAMATTASADCISFSAAEGYTSDYINGQPGTGSVWNSTANGSSTIFRVYQSYSAPHVDLLAINLSGEHGSSSEPVTPDYATKRMVPVTGTFSAGFSFRFGSQSHTYDTTSIALGQSADADWGPYFGLNKLSDSSLAIHDGSGWVELVNGLESGWYDVEVVGDIAAGTFDVKVYLEEDRSETDANLGLVYQGTDLAFRDSPSELAYVMLTNEGSGQDTGAYYHHYDDLYLVPAPATSVLLAMAGPALLWRKR